MQKSIASGVFGFILIIIIIESTSLISSLPTNQSATLSPSTAQFSPAVTSTLPATLMPLQAEPVKNAQPAVLPAPDSGITENIVNGGTVQGADNTVTGPAGEVSAPSPSSANSLPVLMPGVGYVRYDEPLPDGDANISDFWRAVSIPVSTLPPRDFVEIFHQDQRYAYNKTAISFNLRNPPMDIEFVVSPYMSTDMKWVPNRNIQKPHGAPDGKISNVSRPDQNSWFEITVLDKANNGTIVQKEGYGGIYDLVRSKEINIREPGYYQILIEGGFIGANTSIRVPREGNVQ